MAEKQKTGKYLKGRPQKPLVWQHFQNRADMVKFIRNGERYWHGEGFGSEKRKYPA